MFFVAGIIHNCHWSVSWFQFWRTQTRYI